jgi:hypothetical protein
MAGLVLLGGEGTSQLWRYTQRRKETGGCSHAFKKLRIAQTSEIEGIFLEGSQVLKRVCCSDQSAVLKLRPGKIVNSGEASVEVAPEHHNAIGIGIGQRL